MKYSAVILSLALGAFALPQDATITSAPAAAPSVSLSPQLSCAAACDPADVNCRAACLGVAHPNSSQVVETNECAAKCDQGDGSKEDSEKFSQCVQSCISAHFPSSQTVGVGAPAPASQAASNVASATDSAGAAISSGASKATSGTGTEPAGPQSTGAANSNKAGLAGAGLAGLAMAIFL